MPRLAEVTAEKQTLRTAVAAAGRGRGERVDFTSDRRAQDLLDSIFRVATELVHGERASLLLRDDQTMDFVIARAVGIAEDVQRQVRVRSGEGIAGGVVASKRSLLVRAAADMPPSTRSTSYRSG